MIFSVVIVNAFSPVFAEEKASPKKATVFKIGYLEKGYFWAFPELMNAIRKSLDNQGWANRVQFPEDIHFSPGWEDPGDAQITEKAKILMSRKDIDMIIAAGTPATATILKANNGKTPIVSIGVSDPVRSGFVLNENDSGIDNFTVRIAPGQYKRMFTIFHDLIRFKKLGLIYYDTPDGRKFSSIDDAIEVAADKKFEIVSYTKIKPEDTEQGCLEGLKWLIDNRIDAFFQPAINCFDWTKSDVQSLIAYLIDNKIPTFAREGTKYVKAGALMGVSTVDFSVRGEFIAKNMIRILNGEKARSVPMIDKNPPKISVNIKVAKQLGLDFPIEFLSTCDELFDQIVLPEDRLKKTPVP